MIQNFSRKPITSKQLRNAVFNVDRERSLLISVVGGSEYELTFPAHMNILENWKRKRELLNSLNKIEGSERIHAILFTVCDTDGEEAMCVVNLPGEKGWLYLKPDEIEQAYTINHIRADGSKEPANIRYNVITKYL